MHLTDISIRSLTPPERGATIYYDDGLKGFGVRVSRGGKKTYVLTYGKERKRVTLGTVGLIKLKEARDKAKNILAGRQLGGDSFPPMTFEEGMKLFLNTHCRQNNRPATARETERLLRRHFLPSLKQRQLVDIDTHDLATIVDGLLGTPSEANHAFTAAQTMFRWAERRRYLPHSPLASLRKPVKAVSRSRVLSDEELAAVRRTARSSGIYGEIAQLLILTGQRTGQIAGLRGEWVGEDTIAFPAQAMKGNREHVIPIGEAAQALLKDRPKQGLLFKTENNRPFNNWSGAKGRFDKDCPLPHWTLHDLRRTFATNMARLQVTPHVVERILAHSTGTVSGVAAIYNRHSYMAEMRQAMEAYETFLASLPES